MMRSPHWLLIAPNSYYFRSLFSLFSVQLRLKSTVNEITPIAIKIVNSFFYPAGSFFTSRITPITIYIIPTIRFPTNIDKVDNMLTYSCTPLVIESTSFEASMLKHPPRKAPHNKLKNMQKVPLKGAAQKRVSVMMTPRQLQQREYLARWDPKDPEVPELSLSRSQEVPRTIDPKRVPTLKIIKQGNLYCLWLLWARQVGIHNKNPQRIDLSSPIENKQSLFSGTCIIHEEYSKNLSKAEDCYYLPRREPTFFS